MRGGSWEVKRGDCLKGMAELEDKSVDVTITDPPYEAEAHTLQRITPKGPGRGKSIPEVKPIEFAAITEEVRAEAARQIARITRRWALVFCQAEAVSAWRSALVEAGMKYRRAMIWVKPDAQPNLSGNMPAMGYETIVAAHAPGRFGWNGGGRPGVYTALRYAGDGPHKHPTMKPLTLMEALVRDFTNPGELICDPFLGSGTTGVAAKKNGRLFLGWELEAKWAKAAQRRIDATIEQIPLFRDPRPKAEQRRLFEVAK